jgi:hypothetical protein
MSKLWYHIQGIGRTTYQNVRSHRLPVVPDLNGVLECKGKLNTCDAQAKSLESRESAITLQMKNIGRRVEAIVSSTWQ